MCTVCARYVRLITWKGPAARPLFRFGCQKGQSPGVCPPWRPLLRSAKAVGNGSRRDLQGAKMFVDLLLKIVREPRAKKHTQAVEPAGSCLDPKRHHKCTARRTPSGACQTGNYIQYQSMGTYKYNVAWPRQLQFKNCSDLHRSPRPRDPGRMHAVAGLRVTHMARERSPARHQTVAGPTVE